MFVSFSITSDQYKRDHPLIIQNRSLRILSFQHTRIIYALREMITIYLIRKYSSFKAKEKDYTGPKPVCMFINIQKFRNDN